MAFPIGYEHEDFNQSDEIINVLTAPGGPRGFGLTQEEAMRHPARNGCCLAFCFQWLKQKLTNSKETAQERLDTVRGKITTIISRQNSQRELWAVGGARQNYTAPAAFIGVGLDEGDFDREYDLRPVYRNGKDIIDKLRKKEGILMEYRWRDNSGHAIAWYLSSGKMFNLKQHIYMFDPNYGEFKVLLKDGGRFIRDYFLFIDQTFRHSSLLKFYLISVHNVESLIQKRERQGMIKMKGFN